VIVVQVLGRLFAADQDEGEAAGALLHNPSKQARTGGQVAVRLREPGRCACRSCPAREADIGKPAVIWAAPEASG